MNNSENHWEKLTGRESPSWYLDPLVAAQKRAVNLDLVHRWTRDLAVDTVLKTDLFEEAYGEDRILDELSADARCLIGMDIAAKTVHAAKERSRDSRALYLAADVRRLALNTASVDLIVSTSTLDHFETAGEFEQAIRELVRVLRPGGILVLILDNPANPFYRMLRWASRRGWAPFLLGYTRSLEGMKESLSAAGLEVTGDSLLIHNPRVVSTLLFYCLRRLLGRHADAPISLLLRLFAMLGRLPTRRFTACFLGARARKPLAG